MKKFIYILLSLLFFNCNSQSDEIVIQKLTSEKDLIIELYETKNDSIAFFLYSNIPLKVENTFDQKIKLRFKFYDEGPTGNSTKYRLFDIENKSYFYNTTVEASNKATLNLYGGYFIKLSNKEFDIISEEINDNLIFKKRETRFYYLKNTNKINQILTSKINSLGKAKVWVSYFDPNMKKTVNYSYSIDYY